MHEAPQPFELYRARTHIRPTAERRTIVLLPLGSMNDEQKKLLEDLRDRPHLRVSYDQGKLEIRSPLPEHEEYARFIDDLVRLFARTRLEEEESPAEREALTAKVAALLAEPSPADSVRR